MESALILSQTIFYSVVSLSIIAIVIFLVIGMYHLVQITKELEKITTDFHNLTDDARERIDDIINRLSQLPIFSFLLTKRKNNHKKTKNEEKKQ